MASDPGDETREDVDPDEAEFSDRLVSFINLGFDALVALAFADSGHSPADVRERFLKKGSSHEMAARVLL